MADRYDFYMNYGSSSGGRSMRNEDFNEEDVWAVVKEKKDSSLKIIKSKDTSSVSNLRRFSTASRMIPKADKPSSHEVKVHHQQSAPVNVPDWSKIYGKNPKKGSHSSWARDDSDNEGDGEVIIDQGDDDDDEDEDEDDDRVPPHEWIAKKYARSQISSFSVCEGVGRTLKGRDLSKVRNAVLTRTGFIE